MMIMGIKMERTAIGSLWLLFIQIIGDLRIGESSSTVVEKGGCVSEEVSK